MDAIYISEGAGVLDIEEEFDRRENVNGRDRGGGDEDEEERYDDDYDEDDYDDYDEDEEEEEDNGGRGELIEGEDDKKYIVEDDLDEDGDDESQQQPSPIDAAGVDATASPRPPLQGIRYNDEVIEGDLVNEDEDEEGEIEERYVDPSIVALAAAQQDDNIISENIRAPMTPSVRDTLAREAASSAIKRQVYDYLMNDRGKEPGEMEVIPEESQDVDVEQLPSPICPVIPLSTVAPVARDFPFAGQGGADNTNNVSSDTDSTDGNDGMDYFFTCLMKDGDDRGGREQKEDRTEEELEGDNYVMDDPSLSTAAASPPLLSVQASPPSARENAGTSSLVQDHPHLTYNYDEVSLSSFTAESATESRSLTSRSKFKGQSPRRRRKRALAPVASTAVGAFNIPVPTIPQFSDRSMSEESLQRASLSRPISPSPLSVPPPSMELSADFAAASAPVSSGMRASSMTSTLQEVNEYLGGEEAEKKLDETMDNIILKARVQMLRETTKSLKCAKLVDVVFKDPENPVKPSEKELDRLKDAIATELTLNEFTASSKLCDVNSAEMFRESNEKLEMLQRKQIMSNPLFSEAYTRTTVAMNYGGHKPVLLHQKPGGGISTTTGTEGEEEEQQQQEQQQQHVPFDTRGNVQYNLHVEFLDIIDTGSKQHNSISKLGDRIKFLNRLVEYKTSAGVSWFRLVKLLSGVISKAMAVIFGDAEPEEHYQQRNNYLASSLDESSISSQLKAKSTETALANDMDMSSIGVELFFGAASELLEKHLTKVCMDVGCLAIYLNIPVVLLRWPKEFTSTTSYKNLLLDSINRFSSKMSMPSMYIIDNILFDDDEKNASPPATAARAAAVPATDMELFFEKDKKDAVRRVFENMRMSGVSKRDMAKELFVGSGDMNRAPSSSGINSDILVAYTAGASIIDNKTPVFENVMNSVVNYMEKRKHLISAAVMKLLRKVKLSIEVYCIQYKLKEVAKNCSKKNKTSKGKGPMRNLMFRTTMPVSPLSTFSMKAAPTTTISTASTAAATTGSLVSSYAPPVSASMRGGDNYLFYDTTQDTPMSSFCAEMFSTKRPNPDIINNRIKRISQWNPSPSSTSCSS